MIHKKLKLVDRQLFDIELLLNGGFFPLEGFLSEYDYNSVVENMRLVSGSIWPIPIVLDISKDIASNINIGDKIDLCDPEGLPIAVLTVSDKWKPNKVKESEKVYGSTDTTHPAINYLFNIAGDYYIGGKIEALAEITHYDFITHRQSPVKLKRFFSDMGWNKIIGFQTRNPMHRAHVELILRSAEEFKANILIQPVVGNTKPGDIDHYTRVKCYQKVLHHFPPGLAHLHLLPLAMRMAGPREALWHALIRKNYGCTHFIVGRDHAGPGMNSSGVPFYGPYDAQALVHQYEGEIDITMIPFQEMVYVKDVDRYQTRPEMEKHHKAATVSGTEFRRLLSEGKEIPPWFSYSNVISQLRSVNPPLTERGIAIFFTGLSGAGKSTLAKALIARLNEVLDRPITLLDGDVVRDNLSSELGFSKKHRDINIHRIGFVASEIVKHRGIVLCAAIAPYEQARVNVRSLVEQHGGFILVHVATSIKECEKRDTKGLYRLARDGKIKGLTGLDDPYEMPNDAEVVLDTSNTTVGSCVSSVIDVVTEKGYIDSRLFGSQVEKKLNLSKV